MYTYYGEECPYSKTTENFVPKKTKLYQQQLHIILLNDLPLLIIVLFYTDMFLFAEVQY